MSSDRNTDLDAAEYLRELFARFRPRIVDGPLFDFSRLHSGSSVFCEVTPISANEVSGIVQIAGAHRVPLRTRGRGHALNGSSLPQKSELVVNTRELTGASHEPDGTVSVGAGMVLWDVDHWLRTEGCALPVLNDGYPGPSVGGFVAAGGFGPGSATAGGFWNNVAEVTIVKGDGRIEQLRRGTALFPWLFGSMGQLGIFVEAKLDIVDCADVPPLAGSGQRGVAREVMPAAQQSTFGPGIPDEAGRLFWFTLFVPEASLDHARVQLDSLEIRHPNTFALRNRYTYLITHREIVAPLIWPYSSPCNAVGSWGILNDVTAHGIEGMLAFDSDFTEIALANGYRRYVQSEVPHGPALYERYFGLEVYSHFRILKREHDPRNLFNRGWVFAPCGG